MAEVDYNTLLQVYQKKLNELMMQNVALEARIIILNQQLATISEELEKLKSSRRKASTGDDK